MTFEREISVIVVRGQNGEMKFYDPVENVHQNGILAISRVPARIHDDCAEEARAIAGKIAEALGHVGVLCVEMFQRGARRLGTKFLACSSTRSRPESIIPATGPSTPASSASSRTTFAPSPAGRLATRNATATR